MAPLEEIRISSVVVSHLGFHPWDLSGLTRSILLLFRGWSAYREPLSALADQVSNLLFDEFYARLGHRMTFHLPNGLSRRVTLDEIRVMTDHLMGLLFETFRPGFPLHYERLHAYWMETGSPAARACLLSRYAELLAPRELELIRRYQLENDPGAGSE
jgi:hypothetical protein